MKLFDEQIRAVSKTSGKPVADRSYKIKTTDGLVIQGRTDSEGRTDRIATAMPEDINLTWLSDEHSNEFPDVPADEGC